jgi:two-component sensor histidine kinase
MLQSGNIKSRFAFILLLSAESFFLLTPNFSRANKQYTLSSFADHYLFLNSDSKLNDYSIHNTGNHTASTFRIDSLAQAYNDLFFYHNHFGVVDSAIYYLEMAQSIYIRDNISERIPETYLKLTELYSSKGNYLEAMNQVFLALEIYSAAGNKKGEAICYSLLCDLLYHEGSYEEGVFYCDQAIAIQTENHLYTDLAVSYRRKSSNLQYVNGELDNALATINQSIGFLQESEDTARLLLESINTRGNIYKYMGSYDEALADFWSNYATAMSNGIFRHAIPALANIGHIYYLLGEYEKALPFLLQAIEIMHDTGITRDLWVTYSHVYLCYEELNQIEEALEYHKLFSFEHSKFQNNLIDQLEAGLKMRYEMEQKEETIFRQAEWITHQYKMLILYISIAGLLTILLTGAFFSIRNIRKKKSSLQQLNQDLDTRNKQNEVLLKEIHHRVKNNLEMVKSLLSLQSAQINDTKIKNVLIACQHRVQSMGIVHQKLYQGRNPGSIEMKDYFISLCDGIADAYKIEKNITINCKMDAIELDLDTAIPIGLIVNELLTNSMKYAFPDNKSGMITISLIKKNIDTLLLLVADNGVGKSRPLNSNGTGFGTQLIHLLTKQLNGTIREFNCTGTSTFFKFKLNHGR